MSTEVIVAIVSGAGALIVALISSLGRRDETSATASASLISGQSDRIDKLENRLDSVEEDLRATRQELQAIQSHAWDLRDALRRALAWIADAVEHLTSPETVPEPPVPDIEEWRVLLDSPPRTRNPPS